jgi:hypothetical protein
MNLIKLLNGNQFTRFPDHKVILEEALIALRQKIGLSFWKHWKRLSIGKPISNGELYTILTNKAAKGKKGAIVAMIAGTKVRLS